MSAGAALLNPDTPHSRSRTTLGVALQVALAALVLAGIFGRMMGYGLRRDEMMFVPPAALLDQAQPYQDFFFNHPPYSIWLFRAVHLLLPQAGLLEAGRIAVFLGWLLLVFGGGALLWLISRSGAVALFGVLALATSDVLLAQAGMAATNNLLPLAFGMVGLGLFTWQLAEDRSDFVPLFLAGLTTAIAVGMKISALALVPPLALGAVLLPRHLPLAQRLRLVALPIWLGGIVGLSPILWLFLRDPALFLAHIIGFHTGPHIAYWRDHAGAEPDLAMTLRGKLELAYSVWQQGSALLLIFLVALTLWLARREPMSNHARADAIYVPLAALLLSIGMSFVPTPGFPQYYVQPLICLPLIMAVLSRQTAPLLRKLIASAAGVAVVLCLILALPRLAEGLTLLRHPDDWQSSRMHQAGLALASALAEAGHPGGRVLTINPIYPLEGGLPVYPEFATGPFAYRVADYAPPDLVAHYRTTSPTTITALLEANPPAAILTGYDSELEAPFLRFAVSRNYSRAPFPAADDRYGKAILYLRREASGPAAPTAQRRSQ